MNGCSYVCEWVCMGVHGCEGVCMVICCVCMGVHGCAWVCMGVNGYLLCVHGYLLCVEILFNLGFTCVLLSVGLCWSLLVSLRLS